MKHKTLKSRLMFILGICTLCVFALSVLGTVIIYRQSMQSIDDINTQLNQVAVQNVDSAINTNCKEYLDSLISASTSAFLDSLADGDEKTYEYYNTYDTWSASVSSTLAWMPSYIRTIGVISLQDDFYNWGRAVPEATKTFLYQTIASGAISSFGDITYFYAGEEGAEYLIAIRAMRNIDSLNFATIGYSFSILDFDAIIEDSYIQHIDIGDTVIYAYLGDTLIYTYPTQDEDDLVSVDSLAKFYSTDQESYLVSEAQIEGTDICIFTLQNISSTQETLSIIFITCLFILLFGGVGIALWGNHLIARLLQRLENLTEIINSVFQDGTYRQNVEIDLAPFSLPQVDELTTVAHAYKDVYDQTNELITENLMRKLLFQEQRFLFLQSQINPHFLYNTLDSIKILSQDPNKSNLASELVTCLSSIMRYSLSRDMLSHVYEEMRIVRQYMLIQRTRFGQRLAFSVLIEEGCGDIELPKMILQPLIENAIDYSAGAKGGTSKVRLLIYTKNNALNITVADTGIGMPPELCERLAQKDFDSLPGHGLKNVMIRLENIFKEKFKVQVRTKKDCYTVLKLQILDQTQFRAEDTPEAY